MAFEFIRDSVDERRHQGLLRQRRRVTSERDGILEIDGNHYLNFASNDYLGMRQHPAVLQSFAEGLVLHGAGSGASPLVTGYSDAHASLEDRLADLVGAEQVLLFNSGFAANQGLCQALFTDQGNIIADKYMHASFIDGALSSRANLKRYRHNDMNHCASLLTGCSGSLLLATEGVFSMDGDCGNTAALAQLAREHDAWLMVDDAHGFMTTPRTDMHDADIYMATFGKAVGTAGAFIAGSAELIDYLVNFCRHYIYSTAMPAAQARATLTSIEVVQQEKPFARLQDNIAYFRQVAMQRALPLMDSDSAIQPILIGDPVRTIELSQRLHELGIWCVGMRSPTVPKGTDRLRITLSALHSRQDIDALLDALALVLTQQGLETPCNS